MNRCLVALLAVLLVSCSKEPISVSTTDNSEIKVERLFEHDGCVVYRFFDSDYRYFVKCRDGRSDMQWSEKYQCGKSTCRRDVFVYGS